MTLPIKPKENAEYYYYFLFSKIIQELFDHHLLLLVAHPLYIALWDINSTLFKRHAY